MVVDILDHRFFKKANLVPYLLADQWIINTLTFVKDLLDIFNTEVLKENLECLVNQPAITISLAGLHHLIYVST